MTQRESRGTSPELAQNRVLPSDQLIRLVDMSNLQEQFVLINKCEYTYMHFDD